ncbi:MAG: hypothetical protein M5U26_23420 [Planctomycetota bacterium]|nr:hypothetical protein [Planctomycetota bacterium]
MDPGEYETCTYCNRSIFPDVAECPYCRHYTDGKGPFGLGAEDSPRRIPRIFVIAGLLVVLAFVLPVLLAVVGWLTSR